MNPYEEDSSSEEIKKNLFRNAMTRDWQSVVTIYKEDPNAHTVKITESGDTALHIAIFDGQEDIVEELVSIIHVAKTPGALEIQNEVGNTPLHLASYLGHIGMCFFIARENSKLMGIRNKAKETPFFLAVLHGRKDVFLCMHSLCKDPREGYNYCRKDKGETILHSAITGEYFDLAFQIIRLYPGLQHSVDEQGITPLHLLASKPSAFRSGSRLRGFHKLIYHCVYVKKLKPSVIPLQGHRDENNAENSRASFGLTVTRWLGKITRLPMGRHRVQKMDAEDPNGQQLDHQQQVGSSKITYGSKGLGLDFGPKKASTHFRGLKLLFKAMLVFLLGSIQIRKIQEEKKKHIWSVQIMDILVKHSSSYQYAYRSRPRTSETKGDRETAPHAFRNVGSKPGISTDQLEHVVDYDYSRPPLADNSLEALQSNKEERKQGIIGNEKKGKAMENEKKESPLLIAAKHGILEMVEMILQTFPVAIHDVNTDEKNIVLLAVENRQPHVYQFLLNQKILKETIFYKRDKYGNSALHLAAMLGDKQPWLIPGPALQMQWEVKWYEFVEKSMPFNFFVRYNYNGQTPWDIFSSTHQKLVKDAGKWLSSTSQSCSVVATLIATVAFTASATVPGGLKSETGIPVLEKEPAFSIFAISTLIALCFSISSVVMFLVFFTSRYHEKDFGMNLPAKLLVELASLLISIAAVLVSFCAAHFFVIKDKLKYTALPLYAVTLLPVALYAFWQFPMYIELAVATFKKEPQRIYE